MTLAGIIRLAWPYLTAEHAARANRIERDRALEAAALSAAATRAASDNTDAVVAALKRHVVELQLQLGGAVQAHLAYPVVFASHLTPRLLSGTFRNFQGLSGTFSS